MKQQLMMLLLGTASVFCSCETQVEQHEKNELRAPAYPLADDMFPLIRGGADEQYIP